MSLFRANDLRGKYPDEINEQIARKIAFILANNFLNKKNKHSKVLVCYDARNSSKKISKGIIKGLSLSRKKIKTINGGFSSTPFFYWQVKETKADLGIMVTASHNPPKYNGLKIVKKDSFPLVNKEYKLLEKEFKKTELPKNKKIKINAIKLPSKLKKYINYLIKESGIKLTKIKDFKIAIDCSNGTVGPEIKKLVKYLNLKAKIIFSNPDGDFPNHSPNPLNKSSLRKIKELIKKESLDFGIIFDGDGDRIVFLDENGRAIRREFIAAYLSKKYLSIKKGLKIAYGPQASLVFKETILENGGKAIAAKTGHAFIKLIMRKKDIYFSGETSGHYFYKKLGYIDNGLFTFLEILKFINKDNRPFSKIFKKFAKYNHSDQINIPLKKRVNRKKFLREIEFLLSKYKPKKIKKIDGLSMFFNDWWFNLRFSNTENLLRLNLESLNKKALKEKIKILSELIKKIEKKF